MAGVPGIIWAVLKGERECADEDEVLAILGRAMFLRVSTRLTLRITLKPAHKSRLYMLNCIGEMGLLSCVAGPLLCFAYSYIILKEEYRGQHASLHTPSDEFRSCFSRQRGRCKHRAMRL